MKKFYFLFILAICCSFNVSLKAQRFVGYNNVFIQSGIKTNNIFSTELGYEQFLGEKADKSIYISIGYGKGKAKLSKSLENVNLTDYTLSIGLRRYFNFNNAIFPFAGAGTIIGKQNLKSKGLPDTVIIDRKVGALIGLKADIGAEYIFNSFSLFANISPIYEFHFKEYTTSFQVGLKYFF